MRQVAIVSLLTLALAVQGVPVEDANTTADATKRYKIEWCKAEGYGSCKKYEDLRVNECFNLDGTYNNNCASVRHDKDVTCYYYKHDGCSGRYMTASDNYRALPERWENQISSWQCTTSDASSTAPPGEPESDDDKNRGRPGDRDRSEGERDRDRDRDRDRHHDRRV